MESSYVERKLSRSNGKLGINEAFWMLYYLMIAIPLHASNKLLAYLSITGMISVFHVGLATISICLFFLEIKNGKLHYEKNNAVITLFGIALIISFTVGIKDESHVLNNVFGDAVMYFMSFWILSITSSRKFKPQSIRWILQLTFNALTVNLALNVLMYVTQSWGFWGLQSFNGGRFGGGYLSLLVVTVIYGVYDYLYEKNIKIWCLAVHIALAIACSMLAQSRTHVLLCFMGCLLLFIPMKMHLSKNFYTRIIALSVIGGLVVFAIMNGNSELVQRIMNMDVTSDTETTASRAVTWIYYWRLIKKTPLGVGFGEILYFINPSMTIAAKTSTYYVDNAFAVVLYKGGWFFGAVYFLLVMRTPAYLIRSWGKRADTIDLLLAIIFVMLVFSTMLLTSQVIHTYAVNAFVWTMVGCVRRLRAQDICRKR